MTDDTSFKYKDVSQKDVCVCVGVQVFKPHSPMLDGFMIEGSEQLSECSCLVYII